MKALNFTKNQKFSSFFQKCDAPVINTFQGRIINIVTSALSYLTELGK